MSLRRYLAEEIALDHADGLLSRREALRRSRLLEDPGCGTGRLRRAGRSGQRHPGCGRGCLQRGGLTHEVRTFGSVDHAFFNDTGPRYDAAAAAEAYKALLDWLDRHLS